MKIREKNIQRFDYLMTTKISLALLLVYILAIALRSIVALRYANMYVFYDEWIYWEMSKQIAEEGVATLRGFAPTFPGILYPCILSICHLFTDSLEHAYYFALIFNNIIISTSIFPVFLLSKKFQLNNKHAFCIVLATLFMPEMIFGAYIFQENLHLTLYLFYIYFFFVSIIERKKTNILKAVLIGMFTYVLELAKQLSMACTLATFAYLLLEIFVSKGERKKRFFDLGSVLFGYISMRCIWSMILKLIYHINDIQPLVSNVNYGELASRLLHFDTYVSVLYPGITYIILIMIAMGVFPVLISLICADKFEIRLQKLNRYVWLSIIMILGVVCVTILINEGNTPDKMRFHFRYFYFLYPLFLIFFAKGIEMIKQKIVKKRLFYGVFLFLSLIILMPIYPIAVGGADCPSLAYVKYFIQETENEYRFIVFMLLWVGIISFLLFKEHIKNALAIWIASIIVIFVIDNVWLYQHMDKVNGESQYDNAMIINDLMKEKEETVLLVTESKISRMKYEIWFEFDYYMTMSEQFEEWLKYQEELTLYVMNNVTQVEGYCPDYILSEKQYGKIIGYEELDSGVEDLYLYERTDDEVGIIEIEGRYEDYWIEEQASVCVYLNNEEEELVTSLIFDTHDIMEAELPFTLLIEDGEGNKTRLDITSIEEQKHTIEVWRDETDEPYELKISSDETFSTDTDSREMSIRILDIVIEE